jgi:hypothetical protein
MDGTDAGPEQATSPLLAAVAVVREGVEGLLSLLDDANAWRSTDADVLAAVGSLTAARAAVEAAHLRLVRHVDTRGIASSSPVASSPQGLLKVACLATDAQARRDVTAAEATAPDGPLARFGDALARGQVSRQHVDAAVRHLVSTLLPEPEERLDPRAWERRSVDLATDLTGMVVGTFQLDAVSGAVLRAALDRWAAPGGPARTGGSTPRRTTPGAARWGRPGARRARAASSPTTAGCPASDAPTASCTPCAWPSARRRARRGSGPNPPASS